MYQQACNFNKIPFLLLFSFDVMKLLIPTSVLVDAAINVNHRKIITKKGDGIDLICSADSEALGCSFKSPAEHSYNMLRGAAYEEGRIQQIELNPNDCAMKITKIIQADNGAWHCNVTSKLPSGEYDLGTSKIQLVVAIPPVEVYLKMDDNLIVGENI